MYKKKCPECGKYTYSANDQMGECINCSAKISKEEAVIAGEKDEQD